MSKPPKRPGFRKNTSAPSGGGKSFKKPEGRHGDKRAENRGDKAKIGRFDAPTGKTASRPAPNRERSYDQRPGPKRADHFQDARPRDFAEKRPPREPRENKEPKSNRLKINLFGLHAVREAWQNPKRHVNALYMTESVAKDFEPHLKTIARRPPHIIVSKEELDRALPPGTVHQGIALTCQDLEETSLTDLIIRAGDKPHALMLVLDQVTDPHNIGAILRSACAFGADGVIMQSKHAPELTGILAKTACGAVDHLPVAYETNLTRSLETLQKEGYFVIGLDERGEKTIAQLPRYDRVVIVLGAEGPGMRRLVREQCDTLVRLPTQEPIASLNVSNAAAVALYALIS